MKLNKSVLYLLPLIKEWSASADLPLNCYALTEYSGGIICKYERLAEAIHPNGIVLKTNDEYKFILYFVRECFFNDYELLLKGRFSEISELAKKIILAKSPTEVDYDFLEGILYKHKRYKRYLEKTLLIEDIDKFTSEYESIFSESEIFKEEVWEMKVDSP